MIYHFIPIKTAATKKTKQNKTKKTQTLREKEKKKYFYYYEKQKTGKNIAENVKKLELLCIIGGNVKQCN